VETPGWTDDGVMANELRQRPVSDESPPNPRDSPGDARPESRRPCARPGPTDQTVERLACSFSEVRASGRPAAVHDLGLPRGRTDRYSVRRIRPREGRIITGANAPRTNATVIRCGMKSADIQARTEMARQIAALVASDRSARSQNRAHGNE